MYFIFFWIDLTSLFHPDKEEPSVTSLESLNNKGNEENINNENNETYSIFTRNRSGSAGSDRTSSAPPSPMKEVRSPEFPTVTPGWFHELFKKIPK